jgi:hypothetical protein
VAYFNIPAFVEFRTKYVYMIGRKLSRNGENYIMKFHNFQPNLTLVIKSRRIMWVERVACVGRGKYIQNISRREETDC